MKREEARPRGGRENVKRNGTGRRAATALGVTVLLLATVGCGTRGGYAPAEDTGPGSRVTAWDRTSDVPEKLLSDGTTILVGDPGAPVTLHLYEDPRCSYCSEFEVSGAGPTVWQLVLERRVRVKYTLASFLDRDGGGGSRNAVNALRAALEQDRFVELHERVFLFQPSAADGGFTEDYLLSLAGQIEGLRGTSFDAAVRDMEYQEFVAESQQAFDESRATGTPSMKIDGWWLPDRYAGVLYEPDLFEDFLEYVRENPAMFPPA
jgi:protein-disulfide isomerase